MEVDLDELSPGPPSGGEGSEGSRANEAERTIRERIRNNPPPVTRIDAPAVPASPPSAPPAPAAPPAAASPEGTSPATGTPRPRLVSEVPATPPPAPVETPPAAPAEEPAAAAAAADEPEEVAEEVDEAEVTRLADEFKASDVECQSWQTEYKANAEELNKILVMQGNRPVGGELVDVARQMHAIQTRLTPEKFGLKEEAPDEVTATNYKAQLETLHNTQERLLSKYERLTGRNEKLADQYDAKVDRVKAEARRNLSAGNEAKNADKAVQRAYDTGLKEWDAAFKEHSAGLTPEESDQLQETLLEKAHAHEVKHGYVPRNFRAWMAQVAPATKATITAKRGREVATNLNTRAEQRRQPAPAGPAAVAAPASPEGLNARDARRAADRRVDTLSRRVTVR